ncbi:MAG: tetratricopeptide repeat protein [Alphaproteobacteria bacterium]|jgi:hypothetical protein|nr:tetratricopeptide repeat protein [Alphaproteobacteria bacterium]
MYLSGKGVTQHFAEALKYLRLAADQGLAVAQATLGSMYSTGEGVPLDETKAVKWYLLAAEQGHALAQSILGLSYASGQGVSQDIVQAHMWLNLAASSFSAADKENRTEVAQSRDRLAKLMTPAEITEAQKLAREWAEQHQ